MGLLFSVISFWSPLTECLVGHLQDKRLCLQQCLKTPWFGGGPLCRALREGSLTRGPTTRRLQFVFLQDREVLKRCFPVERWGRRAPFLATHCVIAAVAASAVACQNAYPVMHSKSSQKESEGTRPWAR